MIDRGKGRMSAISKDMALATLRMPEATPCGFGCRGRHGQGFHGLAALVIAAGVVQATAVGAPAPRFTRDDLAAEVARLGWIVYSARSAAGDWDLLACRPDGSNSRNLTHTPESSEGYPVLSPDGRRMLYRRIGRDDAFDGNQYGAQGQAVMSGTDGTGGRVLGEAGQFPWACWSADASRLVCLSLAGLEVFDAATLESLQVLDRKGFFQQITVSPNGDCLSGVANGFGTAWSVGRYELGSGRINAVSAGDSCTPNWFPDGRTLVFSRRTPGQKANGGYGWTQLWACAADGSSPRLLVAEEGRHLYGGHVSPDGRFVVFTGNQQEDGDAGHRGARMSILRLADAPVILGDCPEARRLCAHAADGPVLDLPEGWEPWWTASPLSPALADAALVDGGDRPPAAAPAPPNAPVEVTARLLEIPPDAIRNDPLYRYAAVLKYRTQRVHRGENVGQILYVAHYRPQFPRAEAADRFRPDVGGSLPAFRVGELHRMALIPNAEQRFIGGVINPYLEADEVFWALRTDLEKEHP